LPRAVEEMLYFCFAEFDGYLHLLEEPTYSSMTFAGSPSKSKHKRLAQNTLSDTSVSATKLMVERESCAKPYLTGYFPG
jgi:hypothetical protein